MKERIPRVQVEQLKAEFYGLVEQIHEETLEYAASIAGSRYNGEELFMEAWWEVLGNFPQIRTREPLPFRVYFQRVIHRRYINLMVDERRKRDLSAAMNAGYEFSYAALDNESTPIISALSRLPKDLKDVIVLQSEGHSSEACASLLGISTDEFQERLDQARILLIHDLTDSKPNIQTLISSGTSSQNIFSEVPPKVDSLTRAEESERLSPPEEDECTLWYIAGSLKKSVRSTSNLLSVLQVNATLRRKKSGRVVPYFKKDAINLLRETLEKYPEITNRLTIPMLVEQIGKDREWVISRLEKFDITPESRFLPSNNRIVATFSAEAVETLKAEAQKHIDPDLGWYTARALTEKVGKSHNWVDKRLSQMKDKSVLRKDAQGTLRSFYPPEVLRELTRQKEEQDSLRNDPKWYER